jgi:hypothetical protein
MSSSSALPAQWPDGRHHDGQADRNAPYVAHSAVARSRSPRCRPPRLSRWPRQGEESLSQVGDLGVTGRGSHGADSFLWIALMPISPSTRRCADRGAGGSASNAPVKHVLSSVTITRRPLWDSVPKVRDVPRNMIDSQNNDIIKQSMR